MTGLNGFDWVLILILIGSTVSAFSRGIIRVLASIVGLIAGVLIASWNYVALARMLSQWIPSFETAEVIAFLLTLILVVAAFSLVASLLSRTVAAVGLGLLDRLLGAVFGVLRGCVIAAVLMTSLAAFSPNLAWVKNSHLAPYFLAEAHALSFVVPAHFQKQVADGATHMLHQSSGHGKSHTLLEWKHSE